MPSNQPKMKTAYKLFPQKVMLVPYESIVGEAPSVKSFGDIDETNAIIINEGDSISDISIHEDGVEVQYTKEGEDIQQLDAGGIGNVDNITTSRQGTATINVNGINHDLIAIKDGLNPIDPAEISENMKFLKDKFGSIGSINITSQGSLELADTTGIPLTVDNGSTNGIGLEATIDVVEGVFANPTILDKGSGYASKPTLEINTSEQKLLDAVYASGQIDTPTIPGSETTQEEMLTFNSDFNASTDIIEVTIPAGSTVNQICQAIYTATYNDASFPVVIDPINNKVVAKSPGAPAGDGTLVYSATIGDITFAQSTPLSTLTQVLTPAPSFEGVPNTGIAASSVVRKGSITKQKWALFFVSEISEDGDLFYSCIPRCVVTDDEPIDTSMKGEKKVCVLNFGGLKIPSTSELKALQDAITPAISDRYNMIFSWNANETPYSEA